MSHLKEIGFENFRVFNNKEFFEICPLTYLTGPNSSGKSSVLKGILLLKCNVVSDLQILDFSGTKHNLGTFENALNSNGENEESMTFTFESDISNDDFIGYSKLPFTTQRSIHNVLIEESSKTKTDIIISLTYKKNDYSGKLRKIEIYTKNQEKLFLELNIGNINEEYHKLFIDNDIISKNKVLKNIFIDNAVRDKYSISKKISNKIFRIPVRFKASNQTSAKYNDEPILVFTKLYESFLEENINLEVNKNLHSYLIGQPLRRILKDFSSLIENTEYIEAVRANTKRLYTNDSQGTSFNELILEYRSREISEKSIQFTNKWLKEFEIADEIVIENLEGVANTVYLKRGEQRVALADLGYGITQFLPILLKISMEETIAENNIGFSIVKKLILLEEPETNLHPKYQSLLADFFIDAINTYEIRFIIETHSEYLIRKMQILVADKKIDSNNTIIYYFNSPQNNLTNKQIVKINILPNGALSEEFGYGFFDEATNLKYELLKIKANSK